MNTIATLLARSGLPRNEANLLLGFALGLERSFIAAHPEYEIEARAAAALQSLYARRRDGEPVAYLIGGREFYGLALRVTPDVLIPRPETELLVERALARLEGRAAPRVLELGTGSGAIAVALAHRRPDAEIWATDSSAAALAIAQANAARHGAAIQLRQGDWFEALSTPGAPGAPSGAYAPATREAAGPIRARFDLIVSNPPYVAAADPHLLQGDLRFEPRLALVGGADGLDCIRHIAHAAPAHLLCGGWLMFEHGWDQGEACAGLLRELGYAGVIDVPDLAGHPRVCEGRFEGPASNAGPERVAGARRD